jgi:probable rRNA maturation factor
MKQDRINCFTHEIAFMLEQEESVKDWLLLLLDQYEQEADCVNYIFCDDNYVLELNRQHLDHDYLTDILTFPYSPPDAPLLADIYISVDRVKENAAIFGVSFVDELHRVMAHGTLHLLGYEDATETDKAIMREEENAALSLRSF